MAPRRIIRGSVLDIRVSVLILMWPIMVIQGPKFVIRRSLIAKYGSMITNPDLEINHHGVCDDNHRVNRAKKGSMIIITGSMITIIGSMITITGFMITIMGSVITITDPVLKKRYQHSPKISIC